VRIFRKKAVNNFECPQEAFSEGYLCSSTLREKQTKSIKIYKRIHIYACPIAFEFCSIQVRAFHNPRHMFFKKEPSHLSCFSIISARDDQQRTCKNNLLESTLNFFPGTSVQKHRGKNSNKNINIYLYLKFRLHNAQLNKI